MSELEITHSHEEGTLIAGTARGDGTADALKTNHWRWSRNLGAWFIPNSRDQFANAYKINRTADALRAAGHEVTVTIDDTPRPVALAEAERAQRLDSRAAALAAKAERREAQAEAAEQANTAAFNALPEGGEPIKIGHHSERGHRAAIARAHRTQDRAIETQQAAKEAEHRAHVAATANDRRHNPTTVGNRIEALQAEIRRHDRTLATYEGRDDDTATRRRESITARKARDVDALTHWHAVQASLIANGTIGNYTAETITAGDLIQERWGTWHRVEKVNAKSVTIAGPFGTYTRKYHEIKGHHRAPQPATT